MLESNGVFQLITKPTRITKNSACLIDHIFTSTSSNPIFPEIIFKSWIKAGYPFPEKDKNGPNAMCKNVPRKKLTF